MHFYRCIVIYLMLSSFKVYRSNNITAVDAVSAIIPKGQCFGLLGVNGKDIRLILD